MKHNQSITLHREIEQTPPQVLQSREINRLLSAAVVNRKFRTLLLTDPGAAVNAGYNGDSFQLSAEEAKFIQSLHASTLQDFAAHLLEAEYIMPAEPSYSPTKTPSVDPAAVKVRVGM